MPEKERDRRREKEREREREKERQRVSERRRELLPSSSRLLSRCLLLSSWKQ